MEPPKKPTVPTEMKKCCQNVRDNEISQMPIPYCTQCGLQYQTQKPQSILLTFLSEQKVGKQRRKDWLERVD